MRSFSKLKGVEVAALPEMSLLRIKTGKPEEDLVYTLLVDRAYSNISKMLTLGSTRLPDNDKLTIVPGFVGSYPNFFFSVDQSQLEQFIAAVRDARSQVDIETIYQTYGIRRSNSDIWRYSDWFNQQHPKYRGLEAGLLDMNRYENL